MKMGCPRLGEPVGWFCSTTRSQAATVSRPGTGNCRPVLVPGLTQRFASQTVRESVGVPDQKLAKLPVGWRVALETLFPVFGSKIGRASCRERVCQYV